MAVFRTGFKYVGWSILGFSLAKPQGLLLTVCLPRENIVRVKRVGEVIRFSFAFALNKIALNSPLIHPLDWQR